MVEHVEGEWKNFVFKMATPESFPIILEHLKVNVYQDEPLNRTAGYSEIKAAELDQLAIHYMEENLSFFAVEKNTNKIAGVRIIREMSKDAVAPNLHAIQSPELQKIIPFVVSLQDESKIFQVLQVENIATFVSISVEREFRYQGLATEMYRRAVLLLKAKGFPAVEGCFSSPYSRLIADKMGFHELTRGYFAEYEDARGDIVFPSATPDDFVAIMVLKL